LPSNSKSISKAKESAELELMRNLKEGFVPDYSCSQFSIQKPPEFLGEVILVECVINIDEKERSLLRMTSYNKGVFILYHFPQLQQKHLSNL
jgi:hypothetical protein